MRCAMRVTPRATRRRSLPVSFLLVYLLPRIRLIYTRSLAR